MKTLNTSIFRTCALFFTLSIIFSSCSDNVTRNDPSFQGLKDNVMWRAVSSQALVENNALTISGIVDYETLTIRLNGKNKGTYVLGLNNGKKATFVDDSNDVPLTFATGINEGDGQVVITDYDEINMTVSGTFRFNAVNVDDNPMGGDILNFQQGVFYKVPVVIAP